MCLCISVCKSILKCLAACKSNDNGVDIQAKDWGWKCGSGGYSSISKVWMFTVGYCWVEGPVGPHVLSPPGSWIYSSEVRENPDWKLAQHAQVAKCCAFRHSLKQDCVVVRNRNLFKILKQKWKATSWGQRAETPVQEAWPRQSLEPGAAKLSSIKATFLFHVHAPFGLGRAF